MNVYKTLPVPESKNYILREVRESDADDLLKVFADERKTAVEALGFKLCEEPLVGDGGEKYFDYYVLKK